MKMMNSAEKTVPRELILAELPGVRAFLRKLTRGQEEDLLQDTMEKALRYQKALDPNRSVRGWLIKTAFRLYLDQRKKASMAPSLLGDRVHDIAQTHSGENDPGELDRLLSRLTEVERRVFVAFHGEELRLAEISNRLDLPEGTVKSHLHRARRKLAQRRASSEK